MRYGKSHWRLFEQGIQKEWLLTNGKGGYASSTIIGAHTRRYHGLLIASFNPPVNRKLILSDIHEKVIIKNKTYSLASYRTPDITEKGYHHLQAFTLDLLPTYIYNIEDALITKRICLVYGENTVSVVYHIANGASSLKLNLAPLINCRDHHENSYSGFMDFKEQTIADELIIQPLHSGIHIRVLCKEAAFEAQDEKYFLNMEYEVEKERGLESLDDHYTPGSYNVNVLPFEEKTVTIIVTVEDQINENDGIKLIKNEAARLNHLLEPAKKRNPFVQRLILAADQFIVQRESTETKTIIAGYPWFTDWGRDTMIAFTGLTLSTGRFQDAREILTTFSKHVKNGLIPNMFPDKGQEALYNTVDASLWFFEAVHKYLKYTKDYTFISNYIFPVLIEIAKYYTIGTDYSIKMDADYLISAGSEGSQLTWMDVKVGNWVPTPRHGKAVEINALWYNAIQVLSSLSEQLDSDNAYYEQLAVKIKASFIHHFWNEEKKYLYDVILPDGIKDEKVRPNQIFALSLSYPVLEGEMAENVLQRVWVDLYTSYGLRTLSQDDKKYCGTYSGNVTRRDGSYHQGTVWPWPLGHFITAFMKVKGYTAENRKKALEFLKPFEDHLNDACIGSISEIFDGDEPLVPRGCFAQAWSVAELLRVAVEDLHL